MMTTTSILLSHLRRSRPYYSLLPTLFSAHQSNRNPNPNPNPLSPPPHTRFTPRVNPLLFHSRPFSTPLGGGDVPLQEDSILPVRHLISLLDAYHDLTGLPWWIVIASSTLALRVVLFPVLILQLNKLKRIGELFPKLPPPLPPPLSGKSYIDQISLFRKERRAIGCPSFLWFLAYFSIQVPSFFLWMTSIRRMSLDHHPGFDCGGALWFQNLTEFSHGVSGPIFPLLIAGLHYINVQISFGTSSVRNVTGPLDLLAKFYKFYLDFLTLPLFFLGYCIPQGSLVYWITNSSLSVIQQLCLKHPVVRAKLGLPDKAAPTIAANPGENFPAQLTISDSPTKKWKISVQNLYPKELLALSVQLLSNGKRERAVPLLRLALEKDPDHLRALLVMGQTLLQNGQLAEATGYFERAISKLFLAGNPTDVENTDLIILSSQWAGVACIRQGKWAEGIIHLERVASLKKPDDPKSKAHYFDGLVLLASALYNEGRKTEAANYLRYAAAYNPAYKEYLEQCENDEDVFVSDLVSSRRGDY
ncbi:hypothetical protein SO802_002580 [Lithocarpus litseifolius]|uniref:ALBINO3-like protein 2, chloroplastic n=1 Tax=Lithocarpus litseifolius TaxID=425828 RepID=A0AAW2E300_9ROSI